MKRCPVCGATTASDDAFCELDGALLVGDAEAARAKSTSSARCPSCGEGTIEDDGFCSVCGKRSDLSPVTQRSFPAIGAKLLGGVVFEAPSRTDHLVRFADGRTALVVLDEAKALEGEAAVLDKAAGDPVFPRVVEAGVDDGYGPYLALAQRDDAVAVTEAAPRLTVRQAVAFARAIVDVTAAVERLGFSWEPTREDFRVRPGGGLALSRLRVPRRLAAGERADVRAVLEVVGPVFLPAPGLDAPARALRLLLPHVVVPGDAGCTAEEVTSELAAIEREIVAPPRGEGNVGGVCDPGLRRPHNEDACATATGTTGGEKWAVLVVCDGVSSSTHAEQASTIAAKTACDALAHFARSGDVSHEPPIAAVATAIRAAHVAVCAQGIDAGGQNPPGTTIVVGLVWRRRLTVGWVGDSRAYWVAEHGSELLTRDHSWANDAVARGEVTEEEAKRSPLAHALTRCLGPLELAEEGNAPSANVRIADVEPEVRTRDLPGPGWIILCTDGFWNYFPDAGTVAELVRSAGSDASPGLLARRLVVRALAAGGQDNTTVLVHEYH